MVDWSLKGSNYNVVAVRMEYKITFMGLEIRVRLDDEQGGDFNEEHEDVAEIIEERLEKAFNKKWRFYDYNMGELVYWEIV